jgi:ATP adenylyltransferase
MSTDPRGPQAWDRLWAPHRKEYLADEAGNFNADTCPFCIAQGVSDSEGLVVVRRTAAFVVMNKYPYNSGHLLVCTNRHVALYDELTEEEVLQIGELTAQGMRTLRSVAKAAGFNIGLNQGNVAGAGIADHLHQHIVPRWAGDLNFMPIVGGTKVLPELIEQTRLLLSESWSD